MMSKENFCKIRLLKLWDILRAESDETHPLTTSRLIDRLVENDIPCERRTLYRAIHALNAYGYEVMCLRGKHENSYYVADRTFETAELRLLIDAVRAAHFIDNRKTEILVDKVARLSGDRIAERLKASTTCFNTTKCGSEPLYYAIDAIHTAIGDGKQISFIYFDYDMCGKKVFRRNGERYFASPVATVYTQDNYYLSASHGDHTGLTSYRIDRMASVTVEHTAISPAAVAARKNVADFRKQAFSMFGGESATVKFEADEKLIDVIYDRFGANTEIRPSRDGYVAFTATVQPSNVFYGWCLSFGGGMKILAPQSIVDRMQYYLAAAVQLYGK